jgi:hypothetical protein
VYTLGDAARATGMSKAALSKAIKQGRISATRKENGNLDIDPAELHRVYPPVNTKPSASEQERTQETLSENTRLQAKVEALGELLGQVKNERDDLRTDRDYWRRQATNLLTHQQPQTPTAPDPAAAPVPEPEAQPAPTAAAPEPQTGQQATPTKRGKLREALLTLITGGGGGLAVLYILRHYGLV